MHRGTLSDLTTFIAVADSLSFRGAGERLGVTPSALSHSMKRLEEKVGMRLVNRTTRSVSLTEAGQRLLERLRLAFDEISSAMQDLNEARGRPAGRLRIYVSSSSAATVVAPVCNCLLSAYANLNLEVEVGEVPIDIVARGFDAGIGPRAHNTICMIAVRVTDPLKICVVGALLLRLSTGAAIAGRPRSPLGHRVSHCPGPDVRLGVRAERHHLDRARDRTGHRQLMPTCLACGSQRSRHRLRYREPGRAVRAFGPIGPGAARVVAGIPRFHLCHPSRRQMPAALRAFIDMMQSAKKPPTLALAA